jgi:hypothetical protein
VALRSGSQSLIYKLDSRPSSTHALTSGLQKATHLRVPPTSPLSAARAPTGNARGLTFTVEGGQTAHDLDSVIGLWRVALEAAQAALGAGRHDLSAAELSERTQRLADERTATILLLDALAHDRHAKSQLVRLGQGL